MNKYEIIGIVGEGAYGIVYKAKNKDSGAFGKSHQIQSTIRALIDLILKPVDQMIAKISLF